jgi:hypothetical protein
MLLITFLVGGMTGMVIEEALGLDWFDFLDEDARAGNRSLLDGLALTREQQVRVDAILEQQEDHLEDYWEGRIPEMRRIVVDSYERIRHELTADQRRRFDERIRATGIPRPREPD